MMTDDDPKSETINPKPLCAGDMGHPVSAGDDPHQLPPPADHEQAAYSLPG